MKTKQYFMISALALLAYSCQDESYETAVQPTPGQDVQFGAALGQNATRTVYGDRDGDAFPIYWENGDEVIVSSPECAKEGGVGSANYKVNVGDNTTQNYATSLDKTGEIGVRWSNNTSAHFYSFYPASHAELGSDYTTMTLTMPAQQDNNIETDQDGNITVVRPDMEACFMYASSTANSGETVNLRYIPLSTAIRFTLNGPSQQGAEPVTVNYVRIYAPQGTVIDGSFTLSFSGTDKPTLTPVQGRVRNYVTMNAANPETNQYLTLGYNESAELCAFLLIPGEMEITDDWYIEIGTSSGKSYKKYLTALPDGNRKLVPGQVHYLPGLPNLDVDSAWDPAHWMANLQRNVYLSEISLPGSWNSGNIDSQPTFQSDGSTINGTDIDAQYKAGVRAFHIDTRWNATREWIWGGVGYTYNPEDLGVATGGASYNTTGGRYMHEDNDTFEDVLLHRIIHEDPSNSENNRPRDDEYMVVICTFAQDSYNVTNFNGNLDWKGRISQICASSDKVVDARTLTPNTCVADVLGKVIVVVNTYSTDAVADSKCLFMNMGMSLVEDEFLGQDYYTTDLKWQNSSSSGLSMYATHAQITSTGGYTPSDRGFAPTLAQRETHLENILNVSKGNYNNLDNYQHNIWYYLGLGGYYYPEDHESVARDLNGWIDGKVDEMSAGGEYYPLGIVLMNCAIQYKDVVQDILEMNNKYRKAYDPTRSPVDGTDIEGNMGGGNRVVHSAAPGYSSGMTDNQTNAIGWTRCR